MTTEHDEALVERVALAMLNKWRVAGRCGFLRTFDDLPEQVSETRDSWMNEARAVIYPPAPPKTRLQVARQICADACVTRHEALRYVSGDNDRNNAMRAVLTALALPAMED